MDQINQFINSLSSVKIIDIVIAVVIILVFKLLSSTISYAIIRLFKVKSKKAKDIRESAFYNPLKVFFTILGIYLAILFLKTPLNISQNVMENITIIFKIISTIAFAIGLARSFTVKSTLVRKIKEKYKGNLDDTTISFFLKILRVIAGLGIGGLIVTLAAQDTAKNLFGGLVIFLDKPFSVGDWIQMDAYEGTIEDITFRTTRIRTFENSLVNVPNSIISNTSVINWSKMEKRRYKANIKIDLSTSVDKLQELKKKILDMLHEREGIIDDSTMVKFDNVSEDGLNLLIYTYTHSVDYESYLSEVEDINYRILKILKEENIELAYDTTNVYIKNN